MLPVQYKMARAALDLSLDQVAERAGLSHLDVAQVEAGGAVGTDVETRLRTVFEGAGIEWIGDDGVRFKGQLAGDGTIPLETLNSYNDE